MLNSSILIPYLEKWLDKIADKATDISKLCISISRIGILWLYITCEIAELINPLTVCLNRFCKIGAVIISGWLGINSNIKASKSTIRGMKFPCIFNSTGISLSGSRTIIGEEVPHPIGCKSYIFTNHKNNESDEIPPLRKFFIPETTWISYPSILCLPAS